MGISALLGSSLTSCGEWHPAVGPVKPQLLLAGPTRVETALEETERYVLVSRFELDDEGNETRRYNIVDWKNKTSCELPEHVMRWEGSLLGPLQGRKKKPLFLLPLVIGTGEEVPEGETPPAPELSFYDELCQRHGDTEYGPVSNSTASFTLDEDGREVMLYGNGKGTLALADPWHDERTQITTGFRAYTFVFRAGVYVAPQLLWVIENGELTQRALDGTLVLSLGKNVTAFSQVLLTQLRVAYVDGEDVYEAVGPSFTPTRIAQRACAPAYRGNSLELFNPCEKSQLTRTNLMTGEVEEFDQGVFEAYTDTGYMFQNKRNEDGSSDLYVLPPARAKPKPMLKDMIRIDPPFADRPFVVDAQHLAGIKNLETETGAIRRSLVVWDVEAKQDREIMPKEAGDIDSFYAVSDYRTSSYWWLVYHDRVANPEVEANQLGTLSIVAARNSSIEQVASEVPPAIPLTRAPAVRGFSIESLPTFTKERALAYIDGAVPLERDPHASRGTLHVRLFSGELGSTIASDVTSYRMVTTPLPGVIYGIEEGEQQGLWFAAL